MVSKSEILFHVPRHLIARLCVFAVVLTIDCVLIAYIPHSAPLLGPVASFGIVVYAMFVGLGYPQLKLRKEDVPFNIKFFRAHLLCVIAVFCANLAALHGFEPLLNSIGGQIVERAALLLGIALLALAYVPMKTWIATIRITSPLWLYASLAGAVAWALRYPFQSLWYPRSDVIGSILQGVAFQSVYAVLHSFSSDIVVDPAHFTIGTAHFAVIIEKSCSGLEGFGLILVFTVVWLSYFRKESRFPQALLLVPCALLAVWFLNVARLCALILIGNAGAPEVAMVGFHSQAGWIAFTAVAFGFSMATQKISWARRSPLNVSAAIGDPALAGLDTGPAVAEELTEQKLTQEEGESPATGAFLIPFLTILAASFVSKAASGYFEWLYPLRFVAAAVSIWMVRAELKKLDWRFGWIAPLSGMAIFLVWIIPSWWTQSPHSNQLGTALAALSSPGRLIWIAFRVAAAGITVPIAEELAFRGYLSRRLINREFDTVPFSSLTVLSMGVSSVIFGLLYGHHWLAGMVAGLAYAAVLKLRGRFGDAVVAHATSNLLLAAWVLLRGDWAQW